MGPGYLHLQLAVEANATQWVSQLAEATVQEGELQYISLLHPTFTDTNFTASVWARVDCPTYAAGSGMTVEVQVLLVLPLRPGW